MQNADFCKHNAARHESFERHDAVARQPQQDRSAPLQSVHRGRRSAERSANLSNTNRNVLYKICILQNAGPCGLCYTNLDTKFIKIYVKFIDFGVIFAKIGAKLSKIA